MLGKVYLLRSHKEKFTDFFLILHFTNDIAFPDGGSRLQNDTRTQSGQKGPLLCMTIWWPSNICTHTRMKINLLLFFSFLFYSYWWVYRSQRPKKKGTKMKKKCHCYYRSSKVLPTTPDLMYERNCCKTALVRWRGFFFAGIYVYIFQRTAYYTWR